MPSRTTLAQLESWISAERLAKYRNTSPEPVGLYEWNGRLASAAFELIGHTEIVLRNAICQHLAAKSQPIPWYDDPYYRFNAQTLKDIAKAKTRAAFPSGQITEGKVTAELSFGFWRFLLSSTYQTTVWPRASRAFQGIPRSRRNRAAIEQQVIQINDTRNRIAHQEPIFHLPPARLEQDIVTFANQINPQAAAWIASTSRIAATLADRPT
ncbi:MAG: Abi family protein [Propionibacteriaceae bacterium]|jgi:hypothetical protein|nr:Abi family protein [Propionibacteriaceae bacterium]